MNLPPPHPRRVSYVVPLPSSPPDLLSLPPPDHPRKGHTGPLYAQHPSKKPATPSKFVDEDSAHPRHRLAVQALALDLSTAMASSGSLDAHDPGGILYTGGRDGLVSSWELGLPTRKRKRKYGSVVPEDPEEEDGSTREAEMDDGDEEDDDSAQWGGGGLDKYDMASRPHLLEGGATAGRKAKVRQERRSPSAATATAAGGMGESGIPLEAAWEIDEDRVNALPAPKAKFRQCLQSHTDWVNDIVLCDYNRTLVSASSDSLLVAWNPHSTNHDDQVTPHHIGRHGDYVRCLATARGARWVASGGFDRKIKLWDISEGRSSPLLELPSPPASIYSLSAAESGNLLAAGTPERVIRVWDPRSRNQVARLGGHTDNVRAVLLSDDGRWLLSASSDTTVKLWSLAGQKCLHTFSHHSSAAWSLFSQHPTFQRFYSGDRSGNICKTDLEGTGDPGEGECIVLARDGLDDGGDVRAGGEGITQLVAQDDAWVWSAGGSSSVKRWRDVAPRGRRAGAIALRNSAAPDPFSDEAADPADRAHTDTSPLPESPPTGLPHDRERSGPSVSFLENLSSSLASTTSSPSPRAVSAAGALHLSAGRPSSPRSKPTAPSPTQRSSLQKSDFPPRSTSADASATVPTATLFEVPYESLVPLTSPDDTYFSPAVALRTQDPDTSTLYSTVSIPPTHHSTYHGFSNYVKQPSSTVSTSRDQRPVSLAETAFESDPQTATLARQDYLDRASASEASPLRSAPDDIIEGRVGLIRCEVLSDRRHAVTIDTDNDILLWDIVEARCLGVFSADELPPPSRRPSDAVLSVSATESSGSGSDAGAFDLLEYVRDRIDGEASVATWCKCDTSLGALTVHLEENRVFDGEVYVDEAHLGQVDDFPPDHRLCLGKWVLRNLFASFIAAEEQLRGNTHAPAIDLHPGRPVEPPRFISLADLGPVPPSMTSSRKARTPGMTIALATPAVRKAVLPLLPMPATSPRNQLTDLTPIPSSPLGTPRLPDTFQVPNTPTGGKTPTMGFKGDDYFSLPPSAPDTPSTPAPGAPVPPTPTLPTPGGTLMGRLRLLGKASKRPSVTEIADQPAVAAVEAPVQNGVVRTAEEEHALQQNRILEAVFSNPITPTPYFDAPPLRYDPNMAILISEETADASAWAVTYRGLVGTGYLDVNVLEDKSPHWLLDFLLGNRANLKEPPKVSFVIQAYNDGNGVSMPEFPNSSARLTANRSLRIRKVMSYIADKLELRTAGRSRAPSISGDSQHASSPTIPNGNVNGTAPAADAVASALAGDAADAEEEESPFKDVPYVPENEFEVLCGEVVLTPRMTLASVRAYYWKQGGDIVLTYRPKVRG